MDLEWQIIFEYYYVLTWMNENPSLIRINYCWTKTRQKFIVQGNYKFSFYIRILSVNCFEFKLNSAELSSTINYDNRKIRRCQWSETVVIFPAGKKSYVYVVIILIVCEWREKETQWIFKMTRLKPLIKEEKKPKASRKKWQKLT